MAVGHIEVRKGNCPACKEDNVWIVFTPEGDVWNCFAGFDDAIASATDREWPPR